MISIAASTIALPPGNHDATLTSLAAVGVEALEVAPSRRWENTWEGLQASEVSAYRKAIEGAGLHIIGLHSLLFDHKELLLFGDTASQRKLADFLVHLSEICWDLGGRTLIWGGGRLRGTVPQEDALTFTIDFMAISAIASPNTARLSVSNHLALTTAILSILLLMLCRYATLSITLHWPCNLMPKRSLRTMKLYKKFFQPLPLI